jgi:glycosyltransferase involved in cell wall biosynthesis
VKRFALGNSLLRLAIGGERTSTMNGKTVLFISSYLPHDFTRDVHGSYQRMRMFADAWARGGWAISFFFFVSPQAARATDAASVQKSIREFWNIDATIDLCPTSTPQHSRADSFWQYYIAPALSLRNDLDYGSLCGPEQLRMLSMRVAGDQEAIFVFRLEAMLPLTMLPKPKAPIYFDIDDIEHRKALRTLAAAPAGKGTWLRHLKILSIARSERAAIAIAAKTFVCSDVDNAYLARKFGSPKIRTVPNAADFPSTPMRNAVRPIVLFLGLLSYAPNNVAANVLVTTIWPLVTRAVPDARLLIVGAGAETVASRNNCPPTVEFTGFVPDVKPYYEQARVICCPILVGGGTRIKLIEAAAYAKAIVSTTVGAEGLDFRDGTHALIRDTPQSIAQACIDLLLDPARATALGEAAREFARKSYARDIVVEKIRRELAA